MIKVLSALKKILLNTFLTNVVLISVLLGFSFHSETFAADQCIEFFSDTAGVPRFST